MSADQVLRLVDDAAYAKAREVSFTPTGAETLARTIKNALFHTARQPAHLDKVCRMVARLLYASNHGENVMELARSLGTTVFFTTRLEKLTDGVGDLLEAVMHPNAPGVDHASVLVLRWWFASFYDTPATAVPKGPEGLNINIGGIVLNVVLPEGAPNANINMDHTEDDDKMRLLCLVTALPTGKTALRVPHGTAREGWHRPTPPTPHAPRRKG